jgi:hypothetical protein
MSLHKRAPIRIAIESFQGYLQNRHNAEQLEHGLSKAASLLENDIPKPLRDIIERANNSMDTIRFATPEKEERAAVEKLWREFEEVVSRHGIQIELTQEEDD